MIIRTEWPDEKVEALKRYWNDGLTCSEIGELIGKTRNSVIGKVRRLDLPFRDYSGQNSAKGGKRERRFTGRAKPRNKPFNFANSPSRISAIVKDGLPIPPPQETDIPRVSTADLEEPHCRWPCGDPAVAGAHAPLFCGMKRARCEQTGKYLAYYCEVHVKRAYGAPQPRRPAPAVPVPAEAEMAEAA